MDSAALRDFVVRRGGVVTLKELRAHVTRERIAVALRTGELVRLRRTLLALPGIDEARAEAVRLGGLVSHLSAAIAHGWKVKRAPDRPMVTVPTNRRVRVETTARVHYRNITVTRPGRATSPIDTVIDCARTLPFDEALSVADSALRSGKVTRDELCRAAGLSPRTGRARAMRVACHATGMAANPFESVLRAIALDVPGFSALAQCPVESVGHCDVGDLGLKLALEAESFEFHAVRGAFDYDVGRYTAMTRLGWLVGRFIWDEVMHRPHYVREVIADLVALRTTRRTEVRGL